jgi:hypothetical protein
MVRLPGALCAPLDDTSVRASVVIVGEALAGIAGGLTLMFLGRWLARVDDAGVTP